MQCGDVARVESMVSVGHPLLLPLQCTSIVIGEQEETLSSPSFKWVIPRHIDHVLPLMAAILITLKYNAVNVLLKSD